MKSIQRNQLRLISLLAVAIVLLVVLLVTKYLAKTESEPPRNKANELVILPPSPDKMVVYLDKSSEGLIQNTGRRKRGTLVNELYRQAFLISAREEAGLSTRDAWLGDVMPEKGPDEVINISTPPQWPEKIEIALSNKTGNNKVAAATLPTDQDYMLLLEKAEELSRETFLTAIVNSGYIILKKKNTSNAKVPQDVEKLLDEMNFLSQFSAIRQLHELIRTEGESPYLMGALVRGYANLGLLTDFHWHPAHKVFLARSMLYAQRMVAKGSHPRWARWHRAYAFAFAGLQKLALDDLEVTEKETTNPQNNKAHDDFIKPAWVDVINEYCRYDTNSLKPQAGNDKNAELTGLLQCVANERAQNGSLVVTKAMEMLKKSPECYRLYDVVCRYGGISTGHPGTTVWLGVFRETAYPRLANMPGMPEDAAKIIRKITTKKDLLSKLFGAREDSATSEFQIRRELIEALLAACRPPQTGTSPAQEKAATTDAGEPSWAALGQLIRELSFVQAWRRIYFEETQLGVSPDETLAELKPLYVDHPYGGCLGLYSWDKGIRQKAFKIYSSFPTDGIEYPHVRLFLDCMHMDPTLGKRLINAAIDHSDTIESDLIEGSYKNTATNNSENTLKSYYAGEIMKVSPWSPYGRQMIVDTNWDSAKKSAKQWEEMAANHPGLMRSLARRYFQYNQFADAIRCIETAISVSPDTESFNSLAYMYKTKGDRKKWIETLKKFLEYPDYSLSHGKVNQEIADYYIFERKWHKALPYAQEAASTYSAWGLLCEAYCYEALREWDKAEDLYKAVALRYRDSETCWYLYCKRTGKGDLESARTVALENAERAEGDPFSRACFFLLEKQPEKAIASLEDSGSPWNKFLLFTIADQMSDSETRDAALKAILETSKDDTNKQNDPLSKDMIYLASLFAEDVDNAKTKVDVKAIEELFAYSHPLTRIIGLFYLANYLDKRGRQAEAIGYWKTCLGYWMPMEKFTRTFSAVKLREHGVTQEEIEAALPKENMEEEPAEKEATKKLDETEETTQQSASVKLKE
jgi:tetratricopeptide (TPR) repeat protein